MSSQSGRSTRGQLLCPPPNHHIAPPKSPHQKGELTSGCKTGPTLPGLHPTAGGQKEDCGGQRWCPVIDILLQVWGGGGGVVSSIFLVHTSRLVAIPCTAPGVLLSLNYIHPLHSSQKYSQTLHLCLLERAGKRLSTHNCLLGPRVPYSRSPGGPRVKLLFCVVLFTHMGPGLNGKGLK